MKTLQQLLLHSLRPQVRHALDPLQFTYQENVGVEDAILYLLLRVLLPGQRMFFMFFDFSSAFNTIQLRDCR